MTDSIQQAIEGMQPGDRRFVYVQKIVCVEASESKDDFKPRNLRHITLADECETLHPNDVAKRIVEVVR